MIGIGLSIYSDMSNFFINDNDIVAKTICYPSKEKSLKYSMYQTVTNDLPKVNKISHFDIDYVNISP